VSSRRFRKLELGHGPLSHDEASGGGTDVCRRCGAEHAEGESHCAKCGGVLGGPGQQEFDEAFHARRLAIETGAAVPHRDPASAAPGATPATVEVGFGSVLAAGALTACIFALVSIPVRVAFAAAARDPMPGRAVFELLCVAALTFFLRWFFAAQLRAL
jgi:hypothetical protein